MGKKACFTGHRPEKIMQGFNENSQKMQRIKRELVYEIENCINQGYDTFYSGAARGIDIICAEIVLAKKAQNPSLKLFLVLPYRNQGDRWNANWKARLEHIKSNSEISLCFCENYQPDCYDIRNKFMVDASDKVIAVFNGDNSQHSGTVQTIGYAKIKHKEIVLIEC